LIEVYPHPALVELAASSERLPYKVSRARSYWPHATPRDRRNNLLREWLRIVDLLEGKIAGVREGFCVTSVAGPHGCAQLYER
jgi:predicted RNase H-like nuclease